MYIHCSKKCRPKYVYVHDSGREDEGAVPEGAVSGDELHPPSLQEVERSTSNRGRNPGTTDCGLRGWRLVRVVKNVANVTSTHRSALTSVVWFMKAGQMEMGLGIQSWAYGVDLVWEGFETHGEVIVGRAVEKVFH